MCFDHASYLDSLSSRVEQAPRDVADDARIQAVRASVPNRSVDLFKAPPAEAIPTVSVELSTIDLGKIEINSIRECYFTLKNFSHEEQGFEILEPQKSSSIVFNFRELSGTLVPEEVRRVYLTLSPLVKGRQTPAFSVSATSDGSRMPVTFNFFGISSRYLQFQTLDLSPVSEIDFGYCCIDFNKKFTKSLPVRVVNISDDSLIINVSSNLAQQCSLFLEQSLKNAVSDLFMAPLESKVIYIAIQPYVNPPATSLVKKQTSFQGSDKSQHASTSSVPRPLVGGIRFLVQLKDEDHGDTSLFTLTTETLRFQAITGQSTLEISESILNLGRSDELNKVYTHELKITNRTPRLPMHFELRTSSDCLTVDRHEVLLEPGKDDSSFCCIILTVKPKDRGFLNERVEVVNLNNTQQVISLAVRLFISPGQLRCSSTSNDEEIHKILWHDVYLMQKTKDVESPEFVLSPDEHQETKSLLVQNVTDELIEIYPKSDLPLDLRWTLHYESGFVMDSHPSHSQDHASGLGLGLTCGPLVMVHPGKSVVAHVSVPCPRVSPDEVTSTSLIKLDGYLSLESEKGFALEQMEISASYCESIAVLDRLSVDLGNIGHLNSWNPVSFDFTLTNISEVLFIYSMKCPKGISIDLEDRLEGQIGILKSSTLTATLHPKLLDDLTPGVKTLVLEIVNTKNSRNRLEVSVVVAVSLPEVRFDRLDQDGIYLPLVPYPALSGSGFSEFTFVIQNLSDQEKKIQIAPALLPEAEEILDISLTTKFGATPTNSAVSLPPSSFLDVRVRGSVKERFSMDNSDSRASWFTSAERHRFGAVMVYTKDTSASSQWESDLHIVDSIPVSGFFVEEQVFSLSRKHIQFQSFSDWEQDRNGVDPRDSKQSDSITITNFSLSQPLEFRVQLEFPVDKGMGLSKLRIHPLDDGMVGVIPPSQSFDIMVELLDSCITGLSEDIKILVFNARSLFAKPQTVTVNIEDIPTPKVGTPIEHIIDHFPPAATLLLEDGSLELSARLTKLDESWRSDSDSQISAPRSAITDASLSESHSGANYPPRLGQPVISLKGCKRISEDGGIPGAGGLFLLDLAQQDLGSNSVTRKLMLENSSPEKMSYRLRVLGGDAPWMTLSRSDGCFDGHGLVSLNDKESQSITLSFSTTVRGVFLAYIVMENVTFPADNKILKIQLEVVAPRNLRRSISGPGNASRGSDLPVNNHVFDVYVSGISNEVEVMDFDNLYFDSSYSGRSLVIHNRESGPLEFVVKGTLAEDAEFLFSVSPLFCLWHDLCG